MIEYDNGSWRDIIFRIEGSVVPACAPISLLSFCCGTAIALIRWYDLVEEVFGDEDYVKNTMTVRIIGVVIGYLLVMRINMALSRWMEGISEVQLMMSKWGDAFNALNSFMAGRGGDQDTQDRVLYFRIRTAHWLSLMSCLAFTSLRCKKLPPLEEVMIHPVYPKNSDGRSKIEKCSFNSANMDDHSPKSGERSPTNYDAPAAVGGGGDEALSLSVLHQPSQEEITALNGVDDKVTIIGYWILQDISYQVRCSIMNTPPPIVSRAYQEISNGFAGFNQAHKISIVPFPFPFAQMVTLLLTALYICLPFYVDVFTKNVLFTPIISFIVPMCYCGLNQIAIELEEPFGLDPNDVEMEMRHERFVTMLQDQLHQPTEPPEEKHNSIERAIINGLGMLIPGEEARGSNLSVGSDGDYRRVSFDSQGRMSGDSGRASGQSEAPPPAGAAAVKDSELLSVNSGTTSAQEVPPFPSEGPAAAPLPSRDRV
eukprot:gnl/TRDRNA2_/TRDRNA2_157249_c0_seq1.p1 gnl/TRDRNA2_/TRDRNA2_157249_c0~~gnl/TRDRNA2_/TRDRNA2_157249_c0_seq1.p1  ORF type:complete len:515 (+),score=47.51 gnl/TRDRNA2_/TRDRNA2_157249_c0_seq1:97-1545(+)